MAKARSFTRAAAELGLSPSAVSHAIRKLEQRLGVSLLARTTRSVAPTAAGEQLLGSLEPALEGVAAGLDALANWREEPSGRLRLTTFHHAARTILAPRLPSFLLAYPEITLEVLADDRPVDIVAQGFDAGIRFGKALEVDMIAVRLEPDVRVVLVGSPDYFERRDLPKSPEGLGNHNCINYRLTGGGTRIPWEFDRLGKKVKVQPKGQLVVNDGIMAAAAVRAGAGLGFLLQTEVAADLAEGRLVSVLDEWCPSLPGCHLYYPNRTVGPALRALIEALRWKGSSLLEEDT